MPTIPPREWLNVAGSFIAFAMICLLGGTLLALVRLEVPQPNRDALMVVIGILSSNVGTIINFFFGSSATNKKQAETIDKQASTIQEAQSALAPLAESKPAVTLEPGESATVKATDQ